MLFSYYFDIDKRHLLNCRFRILQYTELDQGRFEVMFNMEIAEIMNGNTVKRESETGTFLFPATPNGEEKHDIDFTRVRYADEKKWIFTAVNNKDTSQSKTIGLISSTANKNPLGMDIYNIEEDFQMELKANNLSILEKSYKPPVLRQTVVNHTFDNPGYPTGFSSLTAKHDATYRNFKLTEFTQQFTENVPSHSNFRISVDIAPYEMPMKGMEVFRLNIPQLGIFILNKNNMEWLNDGAPISNVKRVFFSEDIKPEDFWGNGFTPKAKLNIIGDGKGDLQIQYNGYTLDGVYDPEKEFNRIEFRGALARLD